MKKLDLKVHPPIILLLSVGLTYVCSRYLPLMAIPHMIGNLYLYLGALGVLVSLAGIWEFRKAKTTIDPTTPEKASQLVSGGIYSLTRNPMYLGMSLIILAAIFKMGDLSSVFGLIFFVFYITTFQIEPEERIIESIFTEEYIEYKKRVRRWI
jgi:protein-S-isoprenylcysteine O-methyltransferase Ste14